MIFTHNKMHSKKYLYTSEDEERHRDFLKEHVCKKEFIPTFGIVPFYQCKHCKRPMNIK